MPPKHDPSEKTEQNTQRYNDYKTEMTNHTENFRAGTLSADDYNEKIPQAKLKFWKNRGKSYAFDPPRKRS